jgi:hypothetical protein
MTYYDFMYELQRSLCLRLSVFRQVIGLNPGAKI